MSKPTSIILDPSVRAGVNWVSSEARPPMSMARAVNVLITEALEARGVWQRCQHPDCQEPVIPGRPCPKHGGTDG